MKRFALAPDVRNRLEQRIVLRELARCDLGVDPRDALRHDAPAPKVHMADLAVAHDALGKTYRFARRAQHRVRIALEERPPMWQVCRRDRIAVRGIPASPAVEHAQHNGPVRYDTARAISAAKPSGSSDAPPTKPPLISEHCMYDATFAAVMLPP